MGSIGSGSSLRWSSKATTESQCKIDIRWMRKQRYLHPGIAGTISWTCRGKSYGVINFKVEPEHIVLTYRTRSNGGQWERIENNIFFSWTPCNYGGRRQWFLCPACHRRVALLYGGKYFRCRHCHNLTYSSQQVSKPDRLMEKARKIRQRMGGGNNLMEPFPQKPRDMHWKTYWRLRLESEEANNYSWVLATKRFGVNI